MSEFLVEITETLSRTYTVKAESKEKALEIIRNAVNKSEIILDADDFVSRNIEIADYDVNADGMMICETECYPEYSEEERKKGWKNMPEIIRIVKAIVFMFIGFGIIDGIMETEKEKRKNENAK